ncbi:branched-chain-amino-acid transaminase [soil metagenome]
MSSTKNLFAFVRQEVVPLEKAFLHVSDLAIQRGYGIFDFLKIQDGQPLFLESYLDRFHSSAELMQLSVPLGREELVGAVADLIHRNDLPLSGMKLILTGGYSENGYNLASPNLLLIQQPLSLPTQAQTEQGIRVITQEYVREIPAAKTINYTMGIRLLQQIRERMAEDVLYHLGGEVSEFPRSNVFMVTEDGRVVTPKDNILRGITRKHVLELAGNRYQAEEGTVTLPDLLQAREVFLTSTTKRILPIVQVDDRVIGKGKPGPVAQALLEDLIALENDQRASLFPLSGGPAKEK